jgi:CBS-domain-containing membrane protein
MGGSLRFTAPAARLKAGELIPVDLEAVMKVKEIMTTAPVAGRPEDNLARAVELLWQADCGVLPIVDDTGRVAGILTDRDICIALGTRNARASDVHIAQVMHPTVYTCQPDDDVLAALALMSDRRVRRLPVVEGGWLVGVVSLSDAVLAGGTGRSGVRPGAVLDTFKSVCAPRLPVVVEHQPALAGKAT